jgi:superfamily I DNA/RNA helicase
MVSTFHSFALQVCRAYAGTLGLPDNFVIFAGGRQRKVVTAGLELYKKTCSEREHSMAEEHCNSSAERGERGRECVDKNTVKRLCQALTQALAFATDPKDMSEELAFVYKYYMETLLECKSLDFASLINEAARLLSTHEPAMEQYGHRYSHVLVDEFQDTSRTQLKLVTSLQRHGAVTVVGDDDQTIFGFNGSNHEK